MFVHIYTYVHMYTFRCMHTYLYILICLYLSPPQRTWTAYVSGPVGARASADAGADAWGMLRAPKWTQVPEVPKSTQRPALGRARKKEQV